MKKQLRAKLLPKVETVRNHHSAEAGVSKVKYSAGQNLKLHFLLFPIASRAKYNYMRAIFGLWARV